MKRTREKKSQPIYQRGVLPPEVAAEIPIRWMSTTGLSAPAPNAFKLLQEWYGMAAVDIGELRDLLLPVAVLQRYGTVASNTEKIANVEKTAKIVRRNFPEREEALFGLVFSSMDLEKRTTRLAMAENALAEAGWKFDPKKRKAKRLEKRDSESFFVACVRAAYKAEFRDEEFKKATKGRKRTICRKIAATLAPWFVDEELSLESGSPIYMAIYKMKDDPK